MDRKPDITPEPSTNYNIDYRDIKYPRLEFKTGTLLLVLPKNYENEKDILQKHKKWIHKKQLIIKDALEEAETKQLNQKRTKNELKNLVHTIAQNIQNKYNYKINKIYFRKMKTKWASYSQNANLTINTLLKYLPQNLIKYIIFHEMTHSLERKHNKRFWTMISKKFQDHQTREKQLLIYWFLIQKMMTNPNT